MTWKEAVEEAVKQLTASGAKLTWSLVKAAAKTILKAGGNK
ncbi:MAG: hypothetical protein QMD65_01340 [Patescibacteria group bacterium]|nr:hypothetical protein [Patescibacteria group bacterium]